MNNLENEPFLCNNLRFLMVQKESHPHNRKRRGGTQIPGTEHHSHDPYRIQSMQSAVEQVKASHDDAWLQHLLVIWAQHMHPEPPAQSTAKV